MKSRTRRGFAQMDSYTFSETPQHYSVIKPASGVPSSAERDGDPGLQKAEWKPAALAVVLQLGALLMTLAIGAVTERYTGLVLNLYALAIVQGCIAMLLSVACRMDVWWWGMQILFPIGLVAMFQLALPPWIYFLGFVFFLSLFWTTFRTQVPFYPSRPDVWHRVAAYLPKHRHIHLVDIGSGLGDLIMHLARAMPESRFVGIEIAPLPWILSRWRARIRGVGNAAFEWGDYETLDFAQYDIVFAYLSPAAMESLWQKASREMLPGSVLMSHEFEIPGAEPDCILQQEGKPSIYVWHF